MDALKQQLLKVQQQLAGLTASQKMLTASLLVIMVMTLFYWSKFASVTELEAVIDKPLSAEELVNVKAAVAEQNVTYEIRNDRVYVPAGRRAQVEQAMSQLALNGKLPDAYTKAADETDDKSNMLESPAARDQRQQDRRRRRVEDMIRRWPDVKDVAVILTGEKRLGILSPDHPTASVSITYGGDNREAKKIVDAARLQVAHIQSGLKPEDVGITVNGRAFKTDDGSGSDDLLANRTAYEQHYVQSISSLFNIPGLKVIVSVKQTTDASFMNKFAVDPKAKVEALTRSVTTSDENTQAVSGGEPGVTANLGVMADATPAAGHTSTSEKTEINNQVAIGYENSTVQNAVGTAFPQSVALRVPDTYYRRIWAHMNPKAAGDPTEAELRPVIQQEDARIRDAVKNAISVTDDKLISVASYYDFEPAPAPDAAAAGLATMPMGTGFGAKEIAVGALAVISLFMVSMMVRKSVPPPVIAAMPAAGPMPDLSSPMLTMHDHAGDVSEAHLTLTGQELTEEAIEAKQVIEQVGSMVKENPDVAANLVKRWLNQD